MRVYLGSAQFGLDYGITNSTGKTDSKELVRILNMCRDGNILDIDTAHDYGDAERVLGLLASEKTFRITTKINLGKVKGEAKELIGQWEDQLFSSLKKLKRDSVDTLLVHGSDVFAGNNCSVATAWLESVLERRIAGRVGVSIYRADELDHIPLIAKGCIQAPVSIYNQNIIRDSRIMNAIQDGCILIARSIFMQGLLVTPANRWPEWMPCAIRGKHQDLERTCKLQDMSLLDACVDYIKGIAELGGMIVGVSQSIELAEIIDSLEREKGCRMDYSMFNIQESEMVDPRYWPT